MISKEDMNFLSREFENLVIDKDKRFLLKYFKTDIQTKALKYFIVFDNYKNFTDHTGIKSKIDYIKGLYDKFKELVSLKEKARKEIDLDLLRLIESGKFKGK